MELIRSVYQHGDAFGKFQKTPTKYPFLWQPLWEDVILNEVHNGFQYDGRTPASVRDP